MMVDSRTWPAVVALTGKENTPVRLDFCIGNEETVTQNVDSKEKSAPLGVMTRASGTEAARGGTRIVHKRQTLCTANAMPICA